MANVNEPSHLPAYLANGSSETERLETRLRELEEECNRLRQALTKAETDRDRYHQAFLSEARAAREFENLDIPTLEALSDGPVETIQ